MNFNLEQKFKLHIEDFDIPKHWQVKKLEDVCEIIMGQSPPSSTYNTEELGLPFFQGKAEFTELYPIVKKWCNSPNKISLPNDILLSVRAPVGTTNIANKKCCIGRGLAAIRNENYKYVFYFLRSIEQQLDKKGTGTTFRAISAETIRTTEIPIPPLPEQFAIVSKIEELLSDLENGKQQLQTAQQQLKIYRQSLLKWAFEGNLTNENVKFGELPTGWKYVKFNDFCKLQRGYDLPLSKIEKGKYPVVTSAGINGYHNDFKANGPCLTTGRSGSVGNIHFIEVEKYWPHNTVLFVKDFCNNKPMFVYYFFKQFNFKSFSASTAVPTLDRKQLFNELVPVPPFFEQELIVQELESKFTICDKIEETISQSLQQAETLRQSILKKAFEGKLIRYK